MRTIITGLVALSAFSMLSAQHMVRNKVRFPKVGEYEILKGDFHIHTSFSDGQVWPTERVSECYNEDLDVFSITDHLEIQRYGKDVTTSADLNRSHEIAASVASDYDLICIKGCEITRDVPPGHTNAIFINDAMPIFNPTNNQRPSSAMGYAQAVSIAAAQGAFVFYNHPFHNLADDKIVMPVEVAQLIAEKKIAGIEVVNGDRFCAEGYRWAMDHNLAVIANSDVHSSMPLAKKQHDIRHRAQTLLLAKERSAAGVREALDAGRTLIWWRDNVVGRAELLEPFLQANLPLKTYQFNGKTLTFTIENNGPQKFTLEPISTDQFFMAHPMVLTPGSETRVRVRIRNGLDQPVVLRFRVINAWTDYQQPFILEYRFNP